MSERLRELERRGLLLKRKLRTLGRPPTAEEEREIRAEAQAIRQGLADSMMEQLIHDRPEVVTHGRPYSGEAAQRGLEEARSRLHRRDEYREGCSNCPAAQVIASAGTGYRIHCRVEDSILSTEGDPQSVLTFCMGDFTACPSWQAEREAQNAGRRAALV